MKHLFFSITALLYLFSLLFAGSVAMAQPSEPVFSYGRVGYAHLSDFSPAKSDAAYNLLMQKRFAEAATLLRQEIAQHPDSLAAFIGLAQATPESWTAQINQLEAAVTRAKDDRLAVTKFKLGTLLYYRWGQRRVPDDMADVVRAQELIHKAWLEGRLPIMAMMLDEIAGVSSTYTRRHPDMTANIHEELIAQLAPEAYRHYQKAQAAGWNVEPPPMAAVPAENLRSLRGVIRSLWNHSGTIVGLWGVKDGLFLFLEEPREADGEEQAEYLERWFEALTQAVR